MILLCAATPVNKNAIKIIIGFATIAKTGNYAAIVS